MDMDTIVREALITPEEIKDLCERRAKLQEIWDNRPKDLTFPKEYLDLKQRDKELRAEIRELNKRLEDRLLQTVINMQREAKILKDFVKDKSPEELAQYIQPNKPFLSQEEILISRADERYTYRYIPASYRLGFY